MEVGRIGWEEKVYRLVSARLLGSGYTSTMRHAHCECNLSPLLPKYSTTLLPSRSLLPLRLSSLCTVFFLQQTIIGKGGNLSGWQLVLVAVQVESLNEFCLLHMAGTMCGSSIIFTINANCKAYECIPFIKQKERSGLGEPRMNQTKLLPVVPR